MNPQQLPVSVKKFEYFMYVYIALFFMSLLSGLFMIGLNVGMLIFYAVLCSILAILTYRTSRYKENIPKYLLLALCVFNLFGLILGLILGFSVSNYTLAFEFGALIGLGAVLGSVSIICHGIAMYFIFNKESREWFKSV